MTTDIDFVITWVDGNDPAWLKERNHYAELEHKEVDNRNIRYRDWDMLRYWFRGVEKFAPWVNNIFFVTYGHLPQWLNTDNPKLRIVNHKDFIPAEFLPTFNSYVIEFYLHKIEGLSERFVYFNDDMYLLDTVKPERFFRNGLPCDIGALSVIEAKRMFGCSVFLAVDLINSLFDIKEALKRNRSKWYSIEYPRWSFYNFMKCRKSYFTGFYNHHLPQGYLKKTYDDVWQQCEDDLIRTSTNKFRSYGDVCHWLIRYWQLASGHFSPYNQLKDGVFYDVKDENLPDVTTCIVKQQKKLVCLNDSGEIACFEDAKQKILSAFHSILPEKSCFEK